MSQSLSWCVTSLARACMNWCASMSDRLSWISLCYRYTRVFNRYGKGVSIPKYDPEEDDEMPLEVFDDSNVQENVWSFVVYIMWLKQRPDSFEWYLKVREQRFDLWRQCVYKVCIL